MQLVRTRLNAGADDSALVTAKLGRSILGDQIELLNGIRTRRISHFVIAVLAGIDAIDKDGIRLLTISIDVWPSGVRHQPRLGKRIWIRRGRPGCEQRERKVVSGYQ